MDVLDLAFSLLREDCLTPKTQHVTEVNSTEISYEQFFAEYIFKNRPCLVKNISRDWVSQNTWINEGKPNFDLLRAKYGAAEVPVSKCNERYFNSQQKCTMKMKDFLNYWQDYIERGYDSKTECLYMKDWHFAIENPTEEVYRTPAYFASDWINEYLLSDPGSKDDYRFVYMGPKGSWTPLHADVFSSFSWSVNICGKKKWVFFPPGQEEFLKDKFGVLAFDIDEEELKDPSKFPHFSPNISKIVLIQEVGDAIFVPSGWHHQVWNLDNTISFNHNWVNACNINKMWEALNDCLASASREIIEFKDTEGWDDQCQLLLKSCFGMNHEDFFRFVAHIANCRLEHLNKGINLRVTGNWTMSTNHMVFDLTRIKNLLIQMVDINTPCFTTFMDEIKLLIAGIDKVIIYYVCIFKTIAFLSSLKMIGHRIFQIWQILK